MIVIIVAKATSALNECLWTAWLTYSIKKSQDYVYGEREYYGTW